MKDDEVSLVEDMIRMVKEYGRYGYCKIAELLREDGWKLLNDKRVERLWRREGLKRSRRSSRSADGCGSMTVPVFG